MSEKIHIPRITVIQSQQEYQTRRQQLLEAVSKPDLNEDIYGTQAITNIYRGKWIEASNVQLQKVAGWFEHPHIHGRDHKGECDFAAIRLCRAYYQFKESGLLGNMTLEKIKSFYLTYDFKSMYLSENHDFLFHTSRYLAGMAFPEDIFTAYGRTGSQLADEDREYLTDFIKFRARQGWAEFDSSCYLSLDWECLSCLYDFAKNEEIKLLAGMMMDVLLADITVDSLYGLYCGAHGRIYGPEARDHTIELTYPLQYLFFGNVCYNSDMMKSHPYILEWPIDAFLSDYRPKELILDIALNRDAVYENRESKHLHCITCESPQEPLEQVEGRIRKYTYWTPEYVLGCVQYQDDYPSGSAAGWYAHHTQHEWDLTIGTRTDSRIFTHHPVKYTEYEYWTGDMGCGCGRFFQHRNVLLALYNIPQNAPNQFIHAYLPKMSFDEVAEENGFIFIREGIVFIALKLIEGYQWTTDGEWKNVEVKSYGAHHGVICEVGLKEDYEDFSSFKREISRNSLKFDRNKLQLEYCSKQAGRIYMDVCGKRLVNGQAVEFSYPTYDCPYMKSEWDSGIVRIIKGNRQFVFDFNRVTIEEVI